MILIRLLGKNLFIGSTLTVLIMIVMAAYCAEAHQDIYNIEDMNVSFDDSFQDDEFEAVARNKRSPCSYGNGGSTGGNYFGGGGFDGPIDGDVYYEEFTARRRNNHGRRRSNKRRRTIHNIKNNDVQEVQEEILTRRKRQANFPNLGGQNGGGSGLKDKIKQIGSKIKNIGSSVREKIKEKIG